MEEIELPPEIEEPVPDSIMFDMSSSASFASYSPPANSYSRSGHNFARYIPRKMMAPSVAMMAPNRQRNVHHAMIIRPQSRPKYRTYATTTYGYTSTTTTTTTTSTTRTTSTTTFEVNQSKMKEIAREFSSLLKSSLFQQHLTEVQAGDQVIKTIEFELPPKIKMEFTLNASGEIKKICLDKTLFDHNISRLLFKRGFAAKLASLNALEKALLSC